MHIPLEADYAIRIVCCLSHAGKRTDAKSISEQTGVTLRFALKILRKLVAAGIVKSYKGTQGGYEIAKDPSEITLRAVIETVEGPYTLSRCVSPDFVCSHPGEGPCRFNAAFAEISKMVNEKLETVTFEQQAAAPDSRKD